MNTLTAMLTLFANSTHAWVIFAAVSTLISFLNRVFFAASSEITNLLRFWAEATVAITIAAKIQKLVFMFVLLNSLMQQGAGSNESHCTSAPGPAPSGHPCYEHSDRLRF